MACVLNLVLCQLQKDFYWSKNSLCKKPHHALLHRDAATNVSSTTNIYAASTTSHTTENSCQASVPTALDQDHSTSANVYSAVNRQTFHVSQNPAVILGTAMVNILHNGVSYHARALIDPASEANFISQRVQTHLKLPVHSTNATFLVLAAQFPQILTRVVH